MAAFRKLFLVLVLGCLMPTAQATSPYQAAGWGHDMNTSQLVYPARPTKAPPAFGAASSSKGASAAKAPPAEHDHADSRSKHIPNCTFAVSIASRMADMTTLLVSMLAAAPYQLHEGNLPTSSLAMTNADAAEVMCHARSCSCGLPRPQPFTPSLANPPSPRD